MSWPDVRPVLLMAVKAPISGWALVTGKPDNLYASDPRPLWLRIAQTKTCAADCPLCAEDLPPFDPPSHDGTDTWKWAP